MSCALMMAGIDLAFPMITKQFMDVWIPRHAWHTMLIVAGFILLFFILRMVFSYIVGYYGHTMGTLIEHDMRTDLFRHIEYLPYSFFSNQKVGQLVNRFVGDLRDIAELSHHGPEDLLISLLMFIGSFIFLIRIHVFMTLCLFFVMMLLVVFSVLKRRDIETAYNKVRESHGEMNARIESSFSGIYLTKSFTNEAVEMEKFDLINSEYRNSWKKVYRAIAIFGGGNGFLIDLMNLTVLILGAYFIMHDQLSFGSFVAYVMYAAFMFQPIRRLMMFVEMFESGISGFKRFCQIMDITPDIKDEPGAVTLSQCKGLIELDHVSFQYEGSDKEVLHDLSLTITPGENVALVGPSGVGKTTIANLIPRFYNVTSGAVKIDDHPIQHFTLESLRKQIGCVQQDVIIFWGTVRENIVYGKVEATEEEIWEAAKQARIDDFIRSLPEGMDSFVGERGVKLSGGQKQRIALARVFLKNPPILILDEATSSLDNETEAEIQKAIEVLSKNRTTITIAHRLSTIQNADTIIVLTDEGIQEKGSHEALLSSNGYYAKLFKAQYKGYMPDTIIENDSAGTSRQD
ncbi:ABC transporter ATP-binding protein/permease [bacterium]|nr:ABC transporter ATP-binding protein/permease [bacterium]